MSHTVKVIRSDTNERVVCLFFLCLLYLGLQNDHIAIMKQIEAGIHDLHLKARAEGKEQAVRYTSKDKEPVASPSTKSSSIEDKYQSLSPFASVNTVSQLSPAFKADLRAGDKILRFGDADSTNGGFSTLKEMVVEGKQLTTVVKRTKEDGTLEVLELALTPAKWSGPGLLGCHLLPLTN